MKRMKKMNIRKRTYKNDRCITILSDLAILICVFLIELVCVYSRIDIGIRNYLFLGAVQITLTMTFMTLLEEYSFWITGFREQAVIITLSGLYSFALISVINLILFRSGGYFISNAVYTLMSIILLALSNYFRNKVRSKAVKPRLLIIEEMDKNFMRMKRAKYGTLSRYDSWYEEIDTSSIENVERFIKEHFSKYDIICMFDEISGEAYDLIIKKAMLLNKDIYIVPKTIDIQKNSAKLMMFDDIMTFCIQGYSLSSFEKFFKRSFDIVLSVIGLVIAAIPMAVIAAAIGITSPGPVLYKQTRLTENKRKFEILKFRTMINDAEKLTGPMFAQKDDPRITRVGKIIRSCRLDELPQLFNILMGDMSIVGPRPERPFFVDEFEKEIDDYSWRFSVKAGLTSLSHVYGRYSTYIKDRTSYDLYYITHYSFFLDLKIVLLTTKTMFLKSAAEGEDEYKLSGDDKQKRMENSVNEFIV